MNEPVRLIKVREAIHADNDAMAAALRMEMKRRRTMLVNLMSSPGAGKTSLILKTIALLKGSPRVGIIEADIDSTVDADRVAEAGATAVQLQTGGFCHLDVSMVRQGLSSLDLDTLDLVIIENVGNLVCPAEFDTGAAYNVMILSVPEGDDKPLKYPLMFSTCDALVVNKTDYLETSLTDFDMERLNGHVRKLNNRIDILPLSCRTGVGLDQWADWLLDRTRRHNG